MHIIEGTNTQSRIQGLEKDARARSSADRSLRCTFANCCVIWPSKLMLQQHGATKYRIDRSTDVFEQENSWDEYDEIGRHRTCPQGCLAWTEEFDLYQATTSTRQGKCQDSGIRSGQGNQPVFERICANGSASKCGDSCRDKRSCISAASLSFTLRIRIAVYPQLMTLRWTSRAIPRHWPKCIVPTNDGRRPPYSLRRCRVDRGGAAFWLLIVAWLAGSGRGLLAARCCSVHMRAGSFQGHPKVVSAWASMALDGVCGCSTVTRGDNFLGVGSHSFSRCPPRFSLARISRCRSWRLCPFWPWPTWRCSSRSGRGHQHEAQGEIVARLAKATSVARSFCCLECFVELIGSKRAVRLRCSSTVSERVGQIGLVLLGRPTAGHGAIHDGPTRLVPCPSLRNVDLSAHNPAGS